MLYILYNFQRQLESYSYSNTQFTRIEEQGLLLKRGSWGGSAPLVIVIFVYISDYIIIYKETWESRRWSWFTKSPRPEVSREGSLRGSATPHQGGVFYNFAGLLHGHPPSKACSSTSSILLARSI